MADKIEYQIIGYLSIFATLSFIVLGLLGTAQVPPQINEQPSLLSGFSYFFTNPFTSGWSKLVWALIVIAPFGALTSMMVLNYTRGR